MEEKIFHLQRFLDAQENDYARALEEIKNGRKTGHWMWYIFPQVAGLGWSETSRYYAIANLCEAEDYLHHPVLGRRLIEVAEALLALNHRTAFQILGTPDDLKLKSCMTLFNAVRGADPVFNQVLVKYFDGRQDPKTLALLGMP
jgi:uncharacterized protein (DUF1810 family)